MPRKKKSFPSGGCLVHHYDLRRNREDQDVFKDEEDYQVYFNGFKTNHGKYTYILYPYCLMMIRSHTSGNRNYGRT